MNITDQLARALAAAVYHEGDHTVFWYAGKERIHMPPWFQPAAWSLVDYLTEVAQRDSEKNSIPY